MSTTTTASVHLGPNNTENLEVHSKTNFEELQNLFDITQRLILEHEAENFECITDWLESFLLDEIYAYARSSNQVYESTSTCLLRFRLMLGVDARVCRSEPKMECSTRRISTFQFLQRIIVH